MNIAQLCQKAMVSFLNTSAPSNIPTGQIYRGIEGSDTSAITTEESKKLLPCVIVDTGTATPNVLFSGNWVVPTSVRVLTQADDETQDTHHTRCQQVFGLIATDTIAADISAALAGFRAFLVIPTNELSSVNSRHFESVFMMNIICCASDVS